MSATEAFRIYRRITSGFASLAGTAVTAWEFCVFSSVSSCREMSDPLFRYLVPFVVFTEDPTQLLPPVPWHRRVVKVCSLDPSQPAGGEGSVRETVRLL